MTEYPEMPDDLHLFAEALVKKLIAAKRPPSWDEHRTEDAIQELFLAGWQVWCETKDVGLAKHSRSNSAHAVAVATPCCPAPVSAMMRRFPIRRASRTWPIVLLILCAPV